MSEIKHRSGCDALGGYGQGVGPCSCGALASHTGEAEPTLFIDFKQATDLIAMFGGEPNDITLQVSDGHSGRGMYASYTDMPEEGTIFLGNSDQEAMPDTPPAATPAAPGEAAVLSIRDALAELVDLMQGVIDGNYEPDSFTLQPARAALSNPAPVAATASVPQAIDQLVSALAESKGWLRDYARALIEDAIDRRHLEVAAPAPASEAVAWMRKWAFDNEAPYKVPNLRGRLVLAGKFKMLPVTKAKIFDDDIALSATPTPGDSADAPVQQAAPNVEQLAVNVGVNGVRLMGASRHIYSFTPEQLQDFAGRIRAALKGEQPAQPSGGERGEV
jgi:hypothetical protein